MFLDPSLGLLWLCAFCCIWYGSIRSLQFLREEKDITVQKATFVQSKKVLLLPILGSIVLVVLFFALDFSITVYILYGLISIVVLASQFFVFAPLFDWVADKISKEPKGFTLPKLGFIPWSGLCLFLFCSAVVTLWLTTANTAGGWIIVDAIAICLGITQMSVLRLPSMKIATLLLLPFLIYDVFWVFISPYFFHGDSVMVSVATRLPPLPLMLKMPRFSDFQYYSILGLGDIVLPGLFIVYLYSFDDYLARPVTFKLSDLKNSYLDYFTLSLIEYTFGYIATLTSGYLMNSGQPALLYLVPFTLGPSALIAWHRGDLGLMWKGHYSVADEEKKKKDAEMQGLLNGTEDERQDEREEANDAPLDSIVVTGSDSSNTGLL